MKKRGEKSLQMIFGLFMLLIISLVVLAMFFKFVKKGGEGLGNVGTQYAQEAAKQEAQTKCQALCDGINSEDTILQFCSQIYSVDWNEDSRTEGAMQIGRWWTCEKKIPCFVLVPNCQNNRYNGNKCRELLAEFQPDKYIKFWMNVDDDVEGEVRFPVDASGNEYTSIVTQLTDYSDGCLLPTSTSDLNDPLNPLPPTLYNWKERFCFTRSNVDGWNGGNCPPPVAQTTP